MKGEQTTDLNSVMETMGMTQSENTPLSDKEIEEIFAEEQKLQFEKDHPAEIKNVSKRFETATFENFDPYNEELKKNMEACKLFPESDKANLLLVGKVGTGKTHLAISTMRIFPKKYVNSYLSEIEGKTKTIKTYAPARCLFLSFYEFIDELEDARNMGKKARQIEEWLHHDCICLDDLRIEDLTVSVKRNLFSLINGVYEAKKKFILTTNATFPEIERYDNRIADRLFENGKALAFTSKSFRRESKGGANIG